MDSSRNLTKDKSLSLLTLVIPVTMTAFCSTHKIIVILVFHMVTHVLQCKVSLLIRSLMKVMPWFEPSSSRCGIFCSVIIVFQWAWSIKDVRGQDVPMYRFFFKTCHTERS